MTFFVVPVSIFRQKDSNPTTVVHVTLKEQCYSCKLQIDCFFFFFFQVQSPREASGDQKRALWGMGQLFHAALPSFRP